MKLVTILLDTEADQAQVLALAQELAEELAQRVEDETEDTCRYDECGVAVTEVR
ncbi:MAG: hypothetical protein ACPG1A_15490 [Halioglobus sp.]